MTPPGISPYKISKDLEEKAKEAKQKKEELDKILPSYMKKEEILEKFGINKFKPIISNILKLNEEKKFADAYDELSKHKNGIDDEINKLRNSIIDDQKKFIEKLSERGYDLSQFSKSLEKVPEDMDEFLNYINGIKSSIKNELRKELDKKISSLNSETRLKILRNYGRSMDSIQTMKDDELFTLLDSIKKEITEYYMQKINVEMERIDRLRSLFEKMKLNTSNFKNIEENVLSAIKAENYDSAIETLRNFNDQTEASVKRIITEIINNLARNVDETGSLGIDTKNYVNDIKTIRELFEKGNFSSAIDMIKALTVSLEESRVRLMGEKLEKVRKEIQELRNQGMDVSEFLKSFEEARNLITAKKFMDAVKTLDNLYNQAKTIQKEKEEVLNSIDEFRDNAKAFSRIGIAVNTEYLEKIRKMAIENSIKARKEFEKYYSGISKRIENARADFISYMNQIVSMLREAGIDAGDLSKILEKSMDSYEFLIRVNEFREKFLSMLGENLGIEERFENREYFTMDIKPIIESIRESVNKFDFASALSNLKKLNDKLLNLRDIFIVEKISNTRKILNDLIMLGLELNKISIDLDTIEKDSELTPEKKLEIASSLEKTISVEVSNFIKPREEFSQSVVKNIELRNIRISTDAIKSTIPDLKTYSGKNDPAALIRVALELENTSKSLMVASMSYLAGISFLEKKMSKFVSDTANFLTELKLAPLDLERKIKDVLARMDQTYVLNSLTHLRSMIREADEIIEQTGLFQERKNLLEMKSVDIVALEPLYTGLEKLKSDFRDMVYESILSLNIKLSSLPVRELAQRLNTAMDKYLSGEYLDAWKNLTFIENSIKSMWNAYGEIANQLSELENRILYFSNLGINLEKSAKILRELKGLAEKGDIKGFRDAYRSSYISVKDEIYAQVDAFLSRVEEAIQKKRGKVNTLIPEGLVTSARRILKLDNAVEAMQQGFEALESIQEYDLLKTISDNLMKRMKSSLEKFGAIAPKELTSGFERIQIMMRQGKYASSISEMNRLLEKFEQLSEKINTIKSRTDELREKISVAVLFGVKTQRIVDLFQRARASFQAMEIEKSLQLLDDAIKEVSTGIERVLGVYLNSLDYMEKLASMLGMDIMAVTKEVRDLSRRIIEFSFRRNSKEKDTITGISNKLKSRLDDLDKQTVPAIFERLDKKLMEIESALRAVGKEESNDVEFLRNGWAKKIYPMVMDALPLIDYKTTKFYIVHMLDFSRDAFTDIGDRIVYSGKIDNYVMDAFKFSESAGEISFSDYENRVKVFISEMEDSINQGFQREINELKDNFKDIAPNDLTQLNDVLLKKDYRSLEVNIFRLKVMLAWVNAINTLLKEKISAVEARIDELERFEIDVSNERRILESIHGKNYFESVQELKKINELLDKRESIPSISFSVKIRARIGGEEIPAVISLSHNGRIGVNGISVDLSGPVEPYSLKIDHLEPSHPMEKEILLKRINDEALKISISYTINNKNFRVEKSVLMPLKIDHGFTAKKATGEEKCGLCRGRIFKDLDMVVCSKCGATYHLQCAQRVKKCISCGNVFDFSEQKEVEVSVEL